MTDENIYEYISSLSSPQGSLLEALYRESHLKTMAPRMVSGPIQGRVLSMIANIVSPQRILEIGTFTGYATLCLAEGLADGGKIDTIDINQELRFISEKYFELSDYRAAIYPHYGDAKEVIPSLNEIYDLVFIDAKKRDYPIYYDLVIDKLRTGGIILADNVLWDGKVLLESPDKTTEAIQHFNQKIKSDPRVENVILPIRDGINMIRKI